MKRSNSELLIILFVGGTLVLVSMWAATSWTRAETFESDFWTTQPIVRTDQLFSAAEQGYILPSAKLSPGATFKEATLEKIKQPLYSKSVRNVSESEKREVFKRYSIDWDDRGGFEVDHLVPLCIGGSNDVTNLWPQPYTGEWNARVKDRLERYVLMEIREGKLDLAESQKEIATDWIKMYKKVLGDKPKESQTRAEEQ